jgi:lipid-binding SYLF domain-containing protein
MKIRSLVPLFVLSAVLVAAESVQDRLGSAAAVFSEVMNTPDKGIPQDLLNTAQCIIIIPGLKKAAFVIGGQFGRGFAECRKAGGRGWAAPAAVRMEGGSFGLQIGGSSTDLIMLVMNRRGVEKLLGNQFTLGSDASAAAGPVGRTANASTDVSLTAEILAWSRARGAFAGISLNGATMRSDEDQNAVLYGRKLTTRDIVMSAMAPPAAAHQLIVELDKYSLRSNSAARPVQHR